MEVSKLISSRLPECFAYHRWHERDLDVAFLVHTQSQITTSATFTAQ
jgi:hypothetical protein